MIFPRNKFASVVFIAIFIVCVWVLLENRHESPKYHIPLRSSSKRFSIEADFGYLSKLSSAPNCSKLEEMCEEQQLISYKGTYEVVRQDVLNFRNTLTVITLNTPTFDVIPILFKLYAPIFNKLVFCVPMIDELPVKLKHLINETIVQYTEKPTKPTGSNFYRCVPLVLDILSKTIDVTEFDGMLVFSDDLIPNLWHFKHNRNDYQVLHNKFWLMNHRLDMFDIDTLKFCRGVKLDNNLDCDIAGKNWTIQMDNQKRLQQLYDEASVRYPNFIENLSKASRG